MHIFLKKVIYLAKNLYGQKKSCTFARLIARVRAWARKSNNVYIFSTHTNCGAVWPSQSEKTLCRSM